MMFRLSIAILIATLLLLLASTAHAQTHPCDAPPVLQQQVNNSAPLRVQFCARPDEQLEAFTVYLDGVASDLRPLTMIAAPNTLGLALYEGPRELQFGKGAHVLQLSTWNSPYPGGPAQEGTKSGPLSLDVVEDRPHPTAPILRGVVR